MQGVGSPSLTDRIIGFVTLNDRVIEDVERDTNATGQAMIVVVLAAIAGAIGSIGSFGENDQNLVWSLLFGALNAILGWIVFSVIAYFVGSTMFATPQTSSTIGQVLRVVGFAQAPKILGVLGFIPVIGGLAWAVAIVWFVVVVISALRQAFEFDTARAVGTAIVALIVQFLVTALLALIFFIIIGIPVAIFDALF